MIRKIITLILVVIFVLVISNLAVFAKEVEFPDLASSHWAYKFVSVLVGDGTVKGNENGFFEPTKMVTRAEFVKMIGKGPTTREVDFADVPKNHWGYSYIMTSGLAGDENNHFNPATPMTRGQTIELLWSRAGKPTGIIAPSIITKQADNKDAVSWIYMYGVMIGSDGIDLRLNDPISRAETATLIVRAREINESSKQINFVDVVSPKLLEVVYNSFNIFNMPYNPDKIITNGEMAQAAVRLASEEFNLTYREFPIEAKNSFQYAKDLEIIGNCIGKDKVNLSFVSEFANNVDTICSLAYATILKSHKPISYGNSNNYYKDVPSMDKNLYNTFLTFVYESGIQLYSKGIIKPSERVTLKNIAAILLQLDDVVGLQSITTTDLDKKGKNIELDMKLLKKLENYPNNWNSFPCILKDVPIDIYNNSFEKMTTLDGSFGKNPVATYNFAREYSGIFIDMLNQYKAYLNKKYGIDVRLTYIPSLVCDNQNGYTLRVKCEILSLNGKSVNYNDVFAMNNSLNTKEKLYNGMTFYADVVTDYTMGTGVGGAFTFGDLIYKEK